MKLSCSQVKSMASREDLESLLPHANTLSWFKPGQRINVDDKMQSDYSYTLSEALGKNFHPEFKPAVTPAEMLSRGVFEGKYLNDCVLEFPREWFQDALHKLRPGSPGSVVNEFHIKSRKPLEYWQEKRWIPIVPGDKDLRGWFQWYCRYYIGRRDTKVDDVQIKRWKAFKRHAGQIVASYGRLGDQKPTTDAQKRAHRPRQRQALLQWAYDPYI